MTPTNNIDGNNNNNKSRSFAIGILFLVICVIIWSGTSIATQYLFNSGTGFESPYFITYIANLTLSLQLMLYRCRRIKNKPPFKLNVEEVNNNDNDNNVKNIIHENDRYIDTVERNIYSDDDNENDCSKRLLDHTEKIIEGPDVNRNSGYTHLDIIKASLWLAPLWFLSNVTWNYALRMTSNSSCTIINNLAASFTLIFSSTLGLERITLSKVIGLFLCFAGAVCVGIEDESNNDTDLQKTKLWGDIIAFISAAIYGMYITCIRLKVPEDIDPQDSGLSMQLIFGYVGIINLIALLPLSLAFIFINFDGIDSITFGIIGYIFINASFDNLIADFLWGRSTLLTSPTIATLGMSLTIPLAMISDMILGKTNALEKKISVIGAILVIIGFIFVTLDIDLRKYCKFRSDDNSILNKEKLVVEDVTYVGIPDNEE